MPLLLGNLENLCLPVCMSMGGGRRWEMVGTGAWWRRVVCGGGEVCGVKRAGSDT